MLLIVIHSVHSSSLKDLDDGERRHIQTMKLNSKNYFNKCNAKDKPFFQFLVDMVVSQSEGGAYQRVFF